MAKKGPRLSVVEGTAIASIFALLTGFARNVSKIAVLRFFTVPEWPSFLVQPLFS